MRNARTISICFKPATSHVRALAGQTGLAFSSFQAGPVSLQYRPIQSMECTLRRRRTDGEAGSGSYIQGWGSDMIMHIIEQALARRKECQDRLARNVLKVKENHYPEMTDMGKWKCSICFSIYPTYDLAEQCCRSWYEAKWPPN